MIMIIIYDQCKDYHNIITQRAQFRVHLKYFIIMISVMIFSNVIPQRAPLRVHLRSKCEHFDYFDIGESPHVENRSSG